MHDLLRRETRWHWSRECDDPFKKCKELLTDQSVLIVYDVTKEMRCDAFEYRRRAVLAHIVNGKGTIPLTSRSLSVSERNYGRIEKEALNIVFGFKKFH